MSIEICFMIPVLAVLIYKNKINTVKPQNTRRQTLSVIEISSSICMIIGFLVFC